MRLILRVQLPLAAILVVVISDFALHYTRILKPLQKMVCQCQALFGGCQGFYRFEVLNNSVHSRNKQ